MKPFRVLFAAVLAACLCSACKRSSRFDDSYRPHTDIFLSEADEKAFPVYNGKKSSSAPVIDSLKKVSSLIVAVSNVEIQAYRIPKGRRFKFVRGKITKIYKGNHSSGGEIAFISFEDLPALNDSSVIFFLAPLRDFKLFKKYNIGWQQYPYSPVFAYGEQKDSLILKKDLQKSPMPRAYRASKTK